LTSFPWRRTVLRRAHHRDVAVGARNAEVHQHVERMPPVRRQIPEAACRVVGVGVRVVREEHVRENLVLLVPLGGEDRAVAVRQDQHVRVIRPRCARPRKGDECRQRCNKNPSHTVTPSW
jgi:hypothetical protein